MEGIMAKTSFSGPLHFAYSKTKPFLQGVPAALNLDYTMFHADFTEPQALATNFTVIKDTGATVALSSTLPNGVVTLTSAATTDDDGGSIQTIALPWLPVANKKLHMWARIKLSDATQSEMAVGLVQPFVTNPEAMLTAAEHIMFTKADGTALVVAVNEADTVQTASTTTTAISMVDDTWMEFGIMVNGTTSIDYYINGNWVANHTANINSDENMGLGFYHISGVATGTKVAYIDYIGAAQER
jgi:hypothetical protein